LDVSGGGDLMTAEFVPGVGGSWDWLTGYLNEDYDWVADGSGVFAVIPGFDADVAPVGFRLGANNGQLGEKIYLSGGSGLPAGYYTLLPARYAMVPGAYRVTASHSKGDFTDMLLGTRRDVADGSSVQAGFRYMPGEDPTVVA